MQCKAKLLPFESLFLKTQIDIDPAWQLVLVNKNLKLIFAFVFVSPIIMGVEVFVCARVHHRETAVLRPASRDCQNPPPATLLSLSN